jgi:hypothetical protein
VSGFCGHQMFRDEGKTIFSRQLPPCQDQSCSTFSLSPTDLACVITRIISSGKETANRPALPRNTTAPSESAAFSRGQRRVGQKKPDCFVFLIASCSKWQSLALGVASPRQPTETVAAWHFLSGYRSSSALQCEHDFTVIHFLFVSTHKEREYVSF